MGQVFFKYAKYILGALGAAAGTGMYCLTAFAAADRDACPAYLGLVFALVLGLAGMILGNMISRLYCSVYEDFLTHAFNRKYFSARMAKELRLKQRTKEPLCVALVDLDNFKKINDCHGHSVGDRVIKRVVKVMEANARGGDAVVRFGGDEFAIIFPKTRLNEARCVMEKIRAAVAQGGFVTISAGVIEAEEGLDLRALYLQADQMLYRAKRGKNAVCAMETG